MQDFQVVLSSSSWSKTTLIVYLLTSVYNNADYADDTDDYNRVIGLAQLKAFSCAKN